MNNTCLALIPARGGSKGIPHKNRALCAGRPLIAWTLQAALASHRLSSVVCSTDDPQIAQLATQAGVSVLQRPAELAGDTSPVLDTILHTLSVLEQHGQTYDYVMLLQPTSPLRNAQDIDQAFAQILADHTDTLATVTALPLRPGLLMLGKEKNGSLYTTPLAQNLADLPRQQAPQLYQVNGAIYVYKRSYLKPNCVLNAPQSALVLPSGHELDIDTPQDLARAEALLKSIHS